MIVRQRGTQDGNSPANVQLLLFVNFKNLDGARRRVRNVQLRHKTGGHTTRHNIETNDRAVSSVLTPGYMDKCQYITEFDTALHNAATSAKQTT